MKRVGHKETSQISEYAQALEARIEHFNLDLPDRIVNLGTLPGARR